MESSASTASNSEEINAMALNAEQPTVAPAEQVGDNNPLKRFQDLVNSPATPDGHKVVAAVAAASTVTVAAVANWLMKATKK